MQQPIQWPRNVSRPSPWVALFMALWLAFLSTASIGARYGNPDGGLAVSTLGALCTLGLADEAGEASPQSLLCPLCATASALPPASNVALRLRPAKATAQGAAQIPTACGPPPALPPPVRAPPQVPVIS